MLRFVVSLIGFALATMIAALGGNSVAMKRELDERADTIKWLERRVQEKNEQINQCWAGTE